ncbi:hypothetical protein PT447_00075 [Aliarcobacter butzleri]|uniref:hypothetical protein n=1 Tax=Aliarcobacter butzleri TaxID=28197 RepID=UPI0024DE73DE|nr:hypothetical protein [Aliarcobacter butzleri]MDK2063315.1 hypothetical protein [Aliarcobacter butzleri]
MNYFKSEEKIIITKDKEIFRVEYFDESKTKIEEVNFQKEEKKDFGDFVRSILNYFLEKYLNLAVDRFKEFREERTVIIFK